MLGASSGFGRGAAAELAAQGANVVVSARRGDVLDELVAAIEADGGRAIAVPADISDAGQVAAILEAAVGAFGHVDVWINNVGIGALGFFWDVPMEDHARVVEVNLTGFVYGSHVALRHFRERGEGILLNVGSVDSKVPLALQSTYAATKAAVLSLGRSLNEELRICGQAERITVGTIMPWAVDTPWWSHAANYTGHAPRMAAMDDPQLVVDAIVAACTEPKAEQPVGWKAHGARISHALMPDLTARMSGDVAYAEMRKGAPAPITRGTIHTPGPQGTSVAGGVRERMRREDAGLPADG